MPNYDLPNAAPQPLRLVQRFVNTVDLEHGREWLSTPGELAAWLAAHGLPGGADLERALELREALRALLRRNGGGGDDAGARALVEAAAREAVALELRDDGVALAGKDALGSVVAVALAAMLDGSWPRLKVCRCCEWAFWDASRNRSASWCSMRLCGNRVKTRAYRRRSRT